MLNKIANKEPNQKKSNLRFLFVTPYYWPQYAACTMLYGSLCSAMVKIGISVTVVTNKDSGLESDGQFPIQPYFEPEVAKVRNPFLRRKGVLAKCLEYLWFTVFVMKEILFSKNVDVIFMGSNPPLIGIPVGILARIKKNHLVYNLQDLFPDSAAGVGLINKTSLLFKLLKKMESLNYKFSDRTITICDSFAAHVHQMEASADVVVIPNWVDSNFMVRHSKNESKLLSRFGISSKFIVLYAGNMGYSHNLEVIIEAASRLRNNQGIHFLFVGEGNRKEAAMTIVKEKRLNNCTFTGFQPFAALPEVYGSCDLGVVTMRSGSEGHAIPSKTWNHFSCSRPVIACVQAPSELAKAIQDSKAGLILPPNDAEALARTIQELSEDPIRCEALGSNGRQYVCRELSMPVILDRYLAALGEVARAPVGDLSKVDIN